MLASEAPRNVCSIFYPFLHTGKLSRQSIFEEKLLKGLNYLNTVVVCNVYYSVQCFVFSVQSVVYNAVCREYCRAYCSVQYSVQCELYHVLYIGVCRVQCVVCTVYHLQTAKCRCLVMSCILYIVMFRVYYAVYTVYKLHTAKFRHLVTQCILNM